MSKDERPPEAPEPEDLIRYDVLVQDALRGVVRKVLGEVARTGLPGDHHFFITFETGAPGVRISTRMKEKYPDDMTIVVQHQYWDLETTEHTFSIGLSFDNVPESLLIPFSAVRGFFDPSVQFGLQFDRPDNDDETEAEAPAQVTSTKLGALPKPDRPASGGNDADGEGAEVVSLDSFRKK